MEYSIEWLQVSVTEPSAGSAADYTICRKSIQRWVENSVSTSTKLLAPWPGGDALWQAADCLEDAIAGRIADGREIPKASRLARGERLIPVRAQMAAKAALYLAMRAAGITNVQLARKLGCDEKEVRRMLDPRHATKLPRIKDTLDVFGKRLVVSVEEAA